MLALFVLLISLFALVSVIVKFAAVVAVNGAFIVRLLACLLGCLLLYSLVCLLACFRK